VRVALADDSALFRRGLAALMTTAGFDVVAEARNGDELLALIATDVPDAVVLDIRMPPTFTNEGLVTAERIRAAHAEVGVLLLSTYAQADYATRLLDVLVDRVGYLLKDRVDDVRTLGEALDRITHGESVVDPEIVMRLLRRHRRSHVIDRLTPRERDVLRLMAEGRSNAGIGRELYLSSKTVEAHAAGVFVKLGLEAESATNRRVLAVLTWLRASGEPS
jgi:DNA-binding NarL/FixJ family response regulator